MAGFVTPGMRVDVLASGSPRCRGTPGTETNPYAKHSGAFGGTDIQKDDEGKPPQVQVVNLLVTPEQAQTLSLASNQFKIQLVLRNPLDTKVAKVQSSDSWGRSSVSRRRPVQMGEPSVRGRRRPKSSRSR